MYLIVPEGSPVSLTSSTSANPTIFGGSSAGDLVLSAIRELLQYLIEIWDDDVEVDENVFGHFFDVGSILCKRWIRFLVTGGLNIFRNVAKRYYWIEGGSSCKWPLCSPEVVRAAVLLLQRWQERNPIRARLLIDRVNRHSTDLKLVFFSAHNRLPFC